MRHKMVHLCIEKKHFLLHKQPSLAHTLCCIIRPFVNASLYSVQCDQKKLPNVYKSCPKFISVEKLKILTPTQKLPKNVGDSGKLIVTKDLKNLPHFGHTGSV